MEFKFELNKNCINFMYKNKIGIMFESVEELAKLSYVIDKLGFYTSQSKDNLKLLVIYKNYKECIINKCVFNEKIESYINFNQGVNNELHKTRTMQN